ncbi:MAG: Ger(x)C family spore germination protein [Dehalobacterium sp.]
MMRKRFTLCILTFFFFLLTITSTGCWNWRELNTLGIVTASGFDRTPDGKISITIQIVKPGEINSSKEGKGGSTGNPVLVLTSTGDTVFDAVRNATMKVDRKLFWPHTKVFVIGEKLAREGLAPILDWIDRDAEPRRLTKLLITRGQAKDIMEVESELEKLPAFFLENLVRVSNSTSTAVDVRIHDFLKMMTSEGRDPFASNIELKGGAEIGQTGNEEDSGGKKQAMLTGAAVFRKDRLVGWLDGYETRGLLWVLGKVESGIIIVPSPLTEEEKVSLEIIRVSSKIKAKIAENGLPTITVEIQEEGNLGEQMSLVDLTKPENWASLEKSQAAAIEKEVKIALRTAQSKLGVDIFGFGETVHRAYPKVWQELKDRWRQVYPTVEVEVKVSAKLRRTGVGTKPSIPK